MRETISPDFIIDWKWLKTVIESETKLQNEIEIGFRRAD